MDPASRCPLCGAANECGVAAGKGVCWCFSVQMPEAALAAVPEAERMQACICEACAAAAALDRALVKPLI